MKTTVYKGREGWQAETTVELDAPYILNISTHKSNRGLATSVTRMKAENGGTSFMMFQDFNERTTTLARCTEKAVKEQHANALSGIEDIKARCAAFYASKN